MRGKIIIYICGKILHFCKRNLTKLKRKLVSSCSVYPLMIYLSSQRFMRKKIVHHQSFWKSIYSRNSVICNFSVILGEKFNKVFFTEKSSWLMLKLFVALELIRAEDAPSTCFARYGRNAAGFSVRELSLDGNRKKSDISPIAYSCISTTLESHYFLLV